MLLIEKINWYYFYYLPLLPLPIVPSAPENLLFKAITFKVLMLIWSPPKKLNGIILSYEISYNEVKVGGQRII